MKKLSVYVKKNSDVTKNRHASPHIHTFQGELVYASAHMYKLGGGGVLVLRPETAKDSGNDD